MRIIAGNLKGKKLASVKASCIRPTSDRLRESIFNILCNRFDGMVVLDLFAGTGALGIEALSRGAMYAYFIDHNKESITLINTNLRSCALQANSTVIQWDIHNDLKCIEPLNDKFGLVFMDPPYNSNLIKPACMHLYQSGALRIGASIVIEHSIDEPLSDSIKRYRLADQRIYRKTVLSVLIFDG